MSPTTDAQPFDVEGPLPRGVAVLEASAGTGKTFTIAALTARYVAEGVPLDRMLVVTFTRMATGELRERVRERLLSAERILDAAREGIAPPVEDRDRVGVLLATGTAQEIEKRHARMARAVTDFDAAPITTTHGFCLEALSSLGFAGDIAPDCTFTEDVSDLVDEVVDDLYARAFIAQPPFLGRDTARAIARAAIVNPAAHLVPDDAVPGSLAARRLRLAEVAREELERRKRDAQIMTYDDLLTRLHTSLVDPAGGAAVARRLRDRYRVVLVDEFQDTDPLQWEIMRTAFGHAGGTLVLIGDPKQAIYAFRGADVYAYLEAVGAAGTRRTLDTNWRSDQGLIDGYDALFAGAQLGHPGIIYRPVRATIANQAPRLTGAPRAAHVRVRVVDRGEPAIGTTKGGYAKTQEAREFIATDVAADVAQLLGSGAWIESRADDGSACGTRVVRPADLAVLVRRNRDATLVRDELAAMGVPAVLAGAGSVFATDAARDWLRLLEAIERPASTPRGRSVALTPFLGWAAARVAAAGDAEWEDVHRRLHAWATVLRTRGVASVLEEITRTERLPERVLGVVDGERSLTDLRHIGQLLHAAASREQLGAAALTAWLRRRIAEAEREVDEERSRRLESDAAAVQVLTIHRSKGLEFPIVYYPYLWDPSWIPDTPEPVFFHDPDNGDRRTLDVGLEGAGFARSQERNRAELRGEDLRLAYVALTRAQHQAVIWWAGSYGARDSPLGRLVFSRQEDGTIPVGGSVVPTDQDATETFERLGAAAPDGTVAVESARRDALAMDWSDPLVELPELEAARFDRRIDLVWRRTSYSDITAGAAHDSPRVASEPEGRMVDDEPGAAEDVESPDGGPAADTARADAEPAEAEPADPDPLTTPALLADMPGGVNVGTLVHDVFEAVDFAAGDLAEEVRGHVLHARARRRVEIGDVETAVAGLCAAIETPLGPLADGLTLRTLSRADRLDELEFELPLAGGERPAGAISPAAIAAVLTEHLPQSDPLRAYAARLAGDEGLRPALRGFLTGSIDLAFRVVPADGARPRYGIADYKTNRLGDPTRPLVVADHHPALVREEMSRSHYMLQGLLYTVALHRYLRWRVPDHDPGTDLLGVFYLFVRGMHGPGTACDEHGAPYGVFAWRPPGALVVALSDLLDRGDAR